MIKVVLLERAVDCSSIEKSTFINYILEDLKNAIKVYREKNKESIEKILAYNHELERDSYLEKIKKLADTRYKRECYKKKFIDSHMADYDENYNYQKRSRTAPKFEDLEYFDFDPNPGTIGIPSDNTIWENQLKTSLEKAFDNLVEGPYFRKATGWRFEYFCKPTDNDINGENVVTYLSSSRPRISLMGVEEEVEIARKKLESSIYDFYKDSSYFGD